MNEMRTRLAAIFAMAMCCGLAMVVALGVIALSGAWLIGGVVALVVVGCVGVAAWAARRSASPSA